MNLPDLAALVREADVADLPALAGRLREAELLLEQRLRNRMPTTVATEPDMNLDADAAARRLGVSPAWLYKNARKLPFAVRIGRRLLFSSQGLERWNRQRAAS